MCKTLEETLCLGYALEGLPVTIVRYFNIYGPRAKDGPYAGVIPRFISAALQKTFSYMEMESKHVALRM